MSAAEVKELGQTVLWWDAKEDYVGSSVALSGDASEVVQIVGHEGVKQGIC